MGGYAVVCATALRTRFVVTAKHSRTWAQLVKPSRGVPCLQWWNPTIEEQAIDRAHRIGQTRTVHVTRITIAGNVDDILSEFAQNVVTSFA